MAKLKVGKPDTKPDISAHTPGNYEGNAKGNYEKQAGWLPDGRVTAAISTGMNAKQHGPVDKSMPNIPPA
jgi:hypothetical protein